MSNARAPEHSSAPETTRPTPIVIAGAGGLGRTVLQFLEDAARRDGIVAAGFLDDRSTALDAFECSAQILGAPGATALPSEARCLIAVGDPEARKALHARLELPEERYHVLVHPLAHVAPTARLGRGCVIGPFAYVGPSAELGRHVVVNATAFVDHDVRVGEFSYLAPHCVISGGARVGPLTLVGAGAVISAGADVTSGARIAPRSVICAR